MMSEGLTCSICFERFDDRNLCSRLLSCGHSFCSGCLERLIYGNAINCPTCRNAVFVPAGVAGLPKNFALLDIVNAAPQHERDGGSHYCEACDGEQHPATLCCLDCKEDMCNTAAGFHTRSKASRDHRVVSLEELKANPKLAAVTVFCPEHNDQYRYLDEDCGHVVCRDCVTLEHSGQKCASLEKRLHLARVGVEASSTITAHDVRGRRRGLGGDLFAVELSTENKEKKLDVNLKDKGNGTYLATYTIPADAKGYLTLSVLLRGAHITDSPFIVRVENPLHVPQVASPDAKMQVFFPSPGARAGRKKGDTGNKDATQTRDPPIGQVRCYACGRKTSPMNDYLNSLDWNRPTDGLRVDGYSALCHPKCVDYSYQDHWKFVRGPC